MPEKKPFHIFFGFKKFFILFFLLKKKRRKKKSNWKGKLLFRYISFTMNPVKLNIKKIYKHWLEEKRKFKMIVWRRKKKFWMHWQDFSFYSYENENLNHRFNAKKSLKLLKTFIHFFHQGYIILSYLLAYFTRLFLKILNLSN